MPFGFPPPTPNPPSSGDGSTTGGTSIPVQDEPPATPAIDDLWFDKNEVNAGDVTRTLDQASARRIAGNVALTTTPAAVDTALDLTLSGCHVGDLIEYTVRGVWNNEGSSAKLDVVTMVGTTPTTSFASRGAVPSAAASAGLFYGQINVYSALTGVGHYTLTAGDISDGSVTLRLYGWGTTATKSILANTEYPLDVYAVNKGAA